MRAKELLDLGNLSDAIDQVIQDVKTAPRDLKSRIFLFELLCFAGEFERAGRQLDTVAQISGDVNVEMGAQIYRAALQAETARGEFFTGSSRVPKFFSEPPAYTVLHLDAVARWRENKITELEALLEESGQGQHPIKGRWDGTEFDAFHDADDLLGPFLEVFFQSDYYWLPFEQIQTIEIQEPRTLKDLLWTPVKVGLHNGALGDFFIPVQYYQSYKHSDDLIKLGRMTDWKPIGEKLLFGMGQRTFFADETEVPLLEIRKIEMTATT